MREFGRPARVQKYEEVGPSNYERGRSDVQAHVAAALIAYLGSDSIRCDSGSMGEVVLGTRLDVLEVWTVERRRSIAKHAVTCDY